MDTFKRSRYYDFCITIYWFDMTAQLKNVFDAAISQYKAMTSYLKWEDLGIICVPNMENKGSMKESSKLGEVIKLAKSIK